MPNLVHFLMTQKICALIVFVILGYSMHFDNIIHIHYERLLQIKDLLAICYQQIVVRGLQFLIKKLLGAAIS